MLVCVVQLRVYMYMYMYLYLYRHVQCTWHVHSNCDRLTCTCIQCCTGTCTCLYCMYTCMIHVCALVRHTALCVIPMPKRFSTHTYTCTCSSMVHVRAVG